MPYVLGNKNEVKGEESLSISNNDFGLDTKVGLTSSVTLDLTYNTDFAQVEADEQQINLDRFSLFFPEKRGFFLENAGLFSAGENLVEWAINTDTSAVRALSLAAPQFTMQTIQQHQHQRHPHAHRPYQ